MQESTKSSGRFQFDRRDSFQLNSNFRLADLDEIAVFQVGLPYFFRIHQGAIVAANVSQSAKGRVDFNQKVMTGNVGIFRMEREVRVRGTTDEKDRVFIESEETSLMRPGNNGEFDMHGILKLPEELANRTLRTERSSIRRTFIGSILIRWEVDIQDRNQALLSVSIERFVARGRVVR